MATETHLPSSLDALVALVKEHQLMQPAQINAAATPFQLRHEDYNFASLEHTLAAPVTARGTTTFDDLASLVDYVNEEKDETTRAYYVARPKPAVTVVLNDTRRKTTEPAEGNPFSVPSAEGNRITSWRDLRAKFAFPLSVEWERWNDASGRKMSQVEFATFIEQNLPDIVRPTGDVMLTVARTLEAKKDVQFASSIRLEDGSQEFKFEEKVEGTAGKGAIAIPTTFDLGIPVFEGGGGYTVPAFLRYRIHNGVLTLWYELDRPHKLIEHALDNSIQTFRQATGVPIYRGTPPHAARE